MELKRKGGEGGGTSNSAYNCTNMELKRKGGEGGGTSNSAYNCTNMELKRRITQLPHPRPTSL